ncbi:hypothetical protein [Aquibium oceanicum]|uniref:Uncharacterized protein n=1 Tax=Aquibium oceanicum TaxID=1670800 RepID=A0A1L3SPX0_9HYPH|nr:hypothetical protein [Aquibium oceanicum]APH71463.1 hypothetical protein BSQ44_08840 [Aquibium oceanicum]
MKVVTESYVAAREAYNAARAAVREAKEAGDDAKAELLQAEVYPLRDRYREEAEVFAAARERVKAFDRATETID